jgi:hypothetical protein
MSSDRGKSSWLWVALMVTTLTKHCSPRCWRLSSGGSRTQRYTLGMPLIWLASEQELPALPMML